MRYALLSVLIWGSLAAQSPAELKGTIVNADKEIAPFDPDSPNTMKPVSGKIATDAQGFVPLNRPTLGAMLDERERFRGRRMIPVIVPMVVPVVVAQ